MLNIILFLTFSHIIQCFLSSIHFALCSNIGNSWNVLQQMVKQTGTSLPGNANQKKKKSLLYELGWILRKLHWAKKANPKSLHIIWLRSQDNVKMTKLYRETIGQRLPGVSIGGWGGIQVGVAIKGHRGIFMVMKMFYISPVVMDKWTRVGDKIAKK